MSKDKCPSIFSPQMATIVFIILQIFFATHAALKIGEYLTNRFHVAVRLFSNTCRSQMMSKCGKNKKVAHEA